MKLNNFMRIVAFIAAIVFITINTHAEARGVVRGPRVSAVKPGGFHKPHRPSIGRPGGFHRPMAPAYRGHYGPMNFGHWHHHKRPSWWVRNRDWILGGIIVGTAVSAANVYFNSAFGGYYTPPVVNNYQPSCPAGTYLKYVDASPNPPQPVCVLQQQQIVVQPQPTVVQQQPVVVPEQTTTVVVPEQENKVKYTEVIEYYDESK